MVTKVLTVLRLIVMENLDEENARKRRRWALYAALIICVLIGGAFAGSRGYKTWMPPRLTRIAADSAGKGKYVDASLAARRALQIDPGHVPAYELMAEICESLRSKDAIAWRRLALEYSNDSLDARLRLAATALHYGEFKTARETLSPASGEGALRADFHGTAGAAAAGLGDLAAAARHYLEAVRLAPEERLYQIGLGTVQLASADFPTQATGKSLLESLASDPNHGPAALRSLSRHFSQNGELEAALRYSERLLHASSGFNDSLAHVELLRRTGRAEFGGALKKLQDEALTDPKKAGALLVSMARAGLAQQAVDWARNAQPDLASIPECRPGLAACYLTTKDWVGLLELTKSENAWPVLNYSRSALRARALKETGDWKLAVTEWGIAVQAAIKSREAIEWLAQTAADWGWKEEAKTALWAATEQTSDIKWAVDRLYQLCLADRDTLGLIRVMKKLVALEPQNDAARNNLAMLSLLLAKDESAARVAQELYRRAPANAACASTHAFALFKNGNIKEAVEVMERLKPGDLEKVEIATYYGIFLAGTDEKEKARKFLALSETAELLPEEKLLVEEAKRAMVTPP